MKPIVNTFGLRRSLVIGALALAGLAFPPARRQGALPYPAKPVRFVVVTAPGGGLAVAGHIVADCLSRNWGQPVIVENRPGAGAILRANM
jgi:tripartite-type tricarboxylate transporter receptor subunit TctC